MSWDIAFPDTIAVPRGKAIATLRDAGAYITGLPKDQHDASVWQTAMECLLLVADKGGPPEFARLALEQAIRSKGNPVYRSPKAETRWRNNYTPVRDR